MASDPTRSSPLRGRTSLGDLGYIANFNMTSGTNPVCLRAARDSLILHATTSRTNPPGGPFVGAHVDPPAVSAGIAADVGANKRSPELDRSSRTARSPDGPVGTRTTVIKQDRR